MENIHFKSKALLVPLMQEYQVSALWMWTDNPVKEWYKQQSVQQLLNSMSSSDQLLFSYSRVNIVDMAKYVEHWPQKSPKQQIKIKIVAPYPQGRATVCYLAAKLGYETNSCEGKLLWERSAACNGQGALSQLGCREGGHY